MITVLHMVKNPNDIERFNRVSCIKALRNLTGSSLKDAKESIDAVTRGQDVELHHVPMASSQPNHVHHSSYKSSVDVLKSNGITITKRRRPQALKKTGEKTQPSTPQQPISEYNTADTLRAIVKKEFAAKHDALARDLIDIIVKHDEVLSDEPA